MNVSFSPIYWRAGRVFSGHSANVSSLFFNNFVSGQEIFLGSEKHFSSTSQDTRLKKKENNEYSQISQFVSPMKGCYN